MANALEQPLLLHDDMDDLRTMKKHEVFLTLKKDLALVSVSIFIFLCVPIISFYNFHSFIFFFLNAIQVAHMAEELVNNSYK